MDQPVLSQTMTTTPVADFTINHPIVTLGPAGTDADYEAHKHTTRVQLVPSFPAALAAAVADRELRALMPVGYLSLGAHDVAADSWVDQHFAHHSTLVIDHLWESTTKPMCIAAAGYLPDLAAARSVAAHPSTRALLDCFRVPGERRWVDAKPLAATMAADGGADACLASVDVVRALPNLRIVHQFQPTMVWVLYGKAATHAC